jgi:hypothetical protein
VKKKNLLIVPLLVLAGCTSYVTPKTWDNAEERCRSNGGVRQVEVEPNGYAEVLCENGATFRGVNI